MTRSLSSGQRGPDMRECQLQMRRGGTEAKTLAQGGRRSVQEPAAPHTHWPSWAHSHTSVSCHPHC